MNLFHLHLNFPVVGAFLLLLVVWFLMRYRRRSRQRSIEAESAVPQVNIKSKGDYQRLETQRSVVVDLGSKGDYQRLGDQKFIVSEDDLESKEDYQRFEDQRSIGPPVNLELKGDYQRLEEKGSS